jgi:predicted alpha-1,2-mannosidase
MAQMGGFYPLWPIATGESGVMLGASAEVVIADAYLKGIRDFDSEAAWQRMKAAALDATPPAGGRGGRNVGFDFYAREGFVPVSASTRSVSHTLEFAQDDFALSQFASALGHDEEARALLARSQGYRRLWDAESGFLRARAEDGRVKEGPFDPLKWDDHAEANAWQSLFGAPHDIDGLAEIAGGREALLARLTEFFERARADEDQRRAYAERHPEDLLTPNVDRPYFWAGNEPDIHAPYLFAMLGRPDLTQHWVAWTRETYYAPTPAGLPGNDDGGTLSAWWIWSALGLYPLVGSDTYVLGTPLFPRLDLAVSGGTFTIATKNGGGGRIYVALVSLDGRPLTKPYLSHAQIKAGSTLVFEMSDVPSSWGR